MPPHKVLSQSTAMTLRVDATVEVIFLEPKVRVRVTVTVTVTVRVTVTVTVTVTVKVKVKAKVRVRVDGTIRMSLPQCNMCHTFEERRHVRGMTKPSTQSGLLELEYRFTCV